MVSSFFTSVTRPLGKIYLALAIAATGAGCGGRFYQYADMPRGKIYLGMTGPEVTAILGSPARVGNGRFGCPNAGSFFMFEPGTHTIEWSYPQPNGTLVIYLDANIVQRIGFVQSKRRRDNAGSQETETK